MSLEIIELTIPTALGNPITSSSEPFDAINFPNLIVIKTVSEYSMINLPKSQKCRVQEGIRRRAVPWSSQLIGIEETIVLDTVHIWDTLTNKIVKNFGIESNIIFSKFCLSNVVFWSINDVNVCSNTSFINEIFYDRDTNIMVVVNYDKDIYTISKYRIRYIDLFELIPLGETKVDINILQSNRELPIYMNVSSLVVNEELVILLYMGESGCVDRLVLINSNDLSIVKILRGYNIATKTIFNKRYIIIMKDDVCFIIYDCNTRDYKHIQSFRHKTCVLSTSNNILVLGNTSSIVLYYFTNDESEYNSQIEPFITMKDRLNQNEEVIQKQANMIFTRETQLQTHTNMIHNMEIEIKYLKEMYNLKELQTNREKQTLEEKVTKLLGEKYKQTLEEKYKQTLEEKVTQILEEKVSQILEEKVTYWNPLSFFKNNHNN